MNNKLITVAIVGNLNEANRMKELLNVSGIECYLPEHELSIENASCYDGQVELQVCENEAEKALGLIKGSQQADVPAPKSLMTVIPPIKKILVPTDFSPYSLNAACYAAHVAMQKGAEITLVHVYFNPVIDPVSYDHFYSFPTNINEALDEIVTNASDLMKRFAKKLELYMAGHELSAIPIKTEVIGGIAEESVLDFGKEGKYDLMVIGIKGKNSSDNWLGSFMTGIVTKSSIPVLAIPSEASYKDTMFKKLMYATNFDKSDGAAIRKLAAIAMPLEVHINVVHIDDTNKNPFINYDLAHFREKYVGQEQLKMDFDLIVNKNLAQAIENYIAEKEIDIISVTSHKRNIITSLFQPSLTKELLFRLTIPMLIFHG